MVSEKSWSQMLPELLQLISDRLPLVDYISFRGVCTSWRSSPSGRAEIANFSKDRLWFMFYDVGDNANDKCYLYSFNHPSCCIFHLPHLKDATVLESKYGWLFAHHNKHFFLYNPLSLEKIDLPKHKVFPEQVCSFTVASTSSDWSAFIVSWTDCQKLRVSWCRAGSKKWEKQTIFAFKDELGTLQAVDCCSCIASADDGKRACSCGLGNNICVIRTDEIIVAYDYVRKAVIDMEVHTVKEDDEVDDVGVCHRDNWLRRFGEDGISISVSSIMFRRREAEHTGWNRYTDTITPGGKPQEDSTLLKHVKAAWIEAKLKKKLRAQTLSLSPCISRNKRGSHQINESNTSKKFR